MPIPKVESEELVIVKLLDGTFAIGRYVEYTTDGVAEHFVQDAYVLMMQQFPSGEIRVAIADFMAPFIQDGSGTLFGERDWIGFPYPLPKNLVSDYTHKKTGIVLANNISQVNAAASGIFTGGQ
jgi:hypothetical protein